MSSDGAGSSRSRPHMLAPLRRPAQPRVVRLGRRGRRADGRGCTINGKPRNFQHGQRGTPAAPCGLHDRPSSGPPRRDLPRHPALRAAAAAAPPLRRDERNLPVRPRSRHPSVRDAGPRLLRALEPLPSRGDRPARTPARVRAVSRVARRPRDERIAWPVGVILGAIELRRRRARLTRRHRREGCLRPREPGRARPRPPCSRLAWPLVRARADRGRDGQGPSPHEVLPAERLPARVGRARADTSGGIRVGGGLPSPAHGSARRARGEGSPRARFERSRIRRRLARPRAEPVGPPGSRRAATAAQAPRRRARQVEAHRDDLAPRRVPPSVPLRVGRDAGRGQGRALPRGHVSPARRARRPLCGAWVGSRQDHRERRARSSSSAGAGMADVGRAAGDRVESARGDRPPSHAASVFGGRVMPKLALYRKARQRSSFRGTDSDYSRSGPWPLDYSRSGPSLITLGLAPLWPLFGTSVWPLAPRSALGLGAAPPSVPAITLGLAAGLAARRRLLWVWYEITLGLVRRDYSGSGTTRLLWVWYEGLVRRRGRTVRRMGDDGTRSEASALVAAGSRITASFRPLARAV